MTKPMSAVQPKALSGRIPFGLAAGSIAVTVLAVGLMVANGDSIVGGFSLDVLVVGTVYAVVGGLLWSRVPGNPIGPMFMAAAWLFSLTFLLDQYAIYGVTTAAGTLPAVGFAAWAGRWLWIPGNALLLCGMPLLFPDGQLPSPRWRPVAAAITVGLAFEVATSAIALLPLLQDPSAAVAADPSNAPGLIGWLAAIGQITLFLVAPVVVLSAVVVRYRSSRGVARQQMRWFTTALVILVAGVIGDELAAGFAPAAQGLVSVVGLVVLPVAIGIAILRYRLYDIDRIISRTIGYLIVTGMLVAVFVGAVLVSQAILGRFLGENPVGVAASTLVVAALFQPLRRRVQRVVDRRFDRARYDGQRTAEAFAERLRDEVDLTTVADDLLVTVDASLRPTFVGTWLRDSGEPAR